MLVLSRKEGEKFVVGGPCVVSINRIKGRKVSVGISAGEDVPIVRGELVKRDAALAVDTPAAVCVDFREAS